MRYILAMLLLLGAGCRHYNPDTDNKYNPPTPTVFKGDLPTDYQMRKAMNAYRKAYPLCAVCGAKTSFGKTNHVHHKLPKGKFPLKKADPDNFVTLCRRHHKYVGHPVGYRSYTGNIDEMIVEMRKVYRENIEIIPQKIEFETKTFNFSRGGFLEEIDELHREGWAACAAPRMVTLPESTKRGISITMKRVKKPILP